MSAHFILFAPFALLLPAAGAANPASDMAVSSDTVPVDGDGASAVDVPFRYGEPSEEPPIDAGFAGEGPFRLVAEAFRAARANQVRIQQSITIRVVPRPSPVRRNMLMDLPSREVAPRFVEHKMGKCVDVSEIAGVQPEGGNRLLLFMRDQRIVGAQLDHSCRARDFYSGFYLSRSSDGRLCVGRDTLLSRSGANCTLTRMRRLIESGD